MASGGWGYTSNPFNPNAAGATGAADSEAEAPRQQAYGAWGGGIGNTQPAPAAAAASGGRGGFLSNFGRKQEPAVTAAPAIQAFNVSNGAAGAGMTGSRESDLARREAELTRREAELNQLAADARPRNWPRCCPFMYHNIQEQIPSWNRSMVRFAYLVELISITGFFYNCLIVLIAIFARVGPGLNWWFISMLALVMGVPLSWWLFYKGIFNSAQTDGATYSYIRTFLTCMLHLAWCVWMILAVPNLGTFSAGVFPMLDFFSAGGSAGLAFGIMYIINIALWGIAGFGAFTCLGLAVAAYRRGDTPRRDYEARQSPVAYA